MESFHTIALRPLLHYADFSGRSRRSDVIALYIFYIAIGFVVSVASIGFGERTEIATRLLVQLVFLSPFAALFVRRLHDSGRSGWWAVIAAPAVGLSFWEGLAMLRGPMHWPTSAQGPSLADAITVLIGLAVLVLLFWEDDPQPNRFGPNPRYDPPEESQLA